MASVGITKEWLQQPVEKHSHDELVAKADEVVPGISDGKLFKVSDICEIHEADVCSKML